MTPPDDRRPAPSRDPKFLGKFNYICFTKDSFNVVFVSYYGPAAMIIARNLPEKEAKELIYALNNELSITANNINEILEEGN